jgi:hypothetical protein
MDPKEQKQEQAIITEDGQRLSINDGEITGTQDTGDGLAYETGNIEDEGANDSDELSDDDK